MLFDRKTNYFEFFVKFEFMEFLSIEIFSVLPSRLVSLTKTPSPGKDAYFI